MDTSRQGDENPNSSVVKETTKFQANSFYGYQIMDQRRHTLTKYLSDEKAQTAINSKPFRKLYHVNIALYELKLAKAQTEHKEPIHVGFFIVQYAKLRMVEF